MTQTLLGEEQFCCVDTAFSGFTRLTRLGQILLEDDLGGLDDLGEVCDESIGGVFLGDLRTLRLQVAPQLRYLQKRTRERLLSEELEPAARPA